MNETKANLQNQTTQLNYQAAQLRNLEVQIDQMASLLTERQWGALPSNSKVNPRQEGNEHVKAIKLRSGKELAVAGQPPMIGEFETEEVIQPSQTNKVVGEQPHQKKLGEKEIESEGRSHRTEPTIPIMYPQRLKKSKLDRQFAKFLEVIKKLHINISFADALEQMLSYVKFMKKILSKKRRQLDFETVTSLRSVVPSCNENYHKSLKTPVVLPYRAQLEIPSLRRPCVIWEQVLTSCRYLYSDDWD